MFRYAGVPQSTARGGRNREIRNNPAARGWADLANPENAEARIARRRGPAVKGKCTKVHPRYEEVKKRGALFLFETARKWNDALAKTWLEQLRR
jgi:hypothetical protein